MIAKKSYNIKWLFFGAVFLVFVIDRYRKYFWVRNDSFQENDYLNEFIAFDIYLPTFVIYVFSTVILSWLLYEVIKALQKKEYVLANLLLGVFLGGVSNVVDRLLYGGVIDYISLAPWLRNFPVFNIADMLISISVVGLGLYYIRKSYHEKRI